jgi:DNA adenine methylase
MSTHGTPLRYPGGKQRLTPFVAEVLAANNLIGGHYAEPYAGGAGVAIDLLINQQVSNIHLNDASRAVYAFWMAILEHTDEFCRRIASTSLSVLEWKRQREILRNPTEHDILELGFSTFYLNRCNRSGVLSGGLIGGLEQTGQWKMDARFPANELIRRIEVIARHRASIAVHNFDAETYIRDYLPELPENSLVYLDPPYFHKSSRLYLNIYQPEDHARLARVIQEELTKNWMVSYDTATEILGYYSERQSFIYRLGYKAYKVYKGEEAFFFSDRLQVPKRSALPFIDSALLTDDIRLARTGEQTSFVLH